MLMGLMLAAGVVSARNIEPKLEAYGNLVKATYYFENGKVSQTGFFKNGKLEGQWVSFDVNGNKKAVAEYADGKKTGQWLYWNDGALSEVTYQENTLQSVKTWKQEALVNRN